MESVSWEVVQERMAALLSSGQCLAVQFNLNHGLLLSVCGGITVVCAYLAYRRLKWRFVNRKRLQRMVHYAKIRKMLVDIAPFDDPPQVAHE